MNRGAGQSPTAPSRQDLPWLAALLLIVAGFLAPLLLRWAPACYCDSLVESAPRAMAIARIVQNGGVPLWDFHTFSGARPFYVSDESAVYYPLMIPFYLMADLDDPSQSTFMLLLLPFVLHLLWAALGGFLFARYGIGLHPAGAFVLGLVYSLSPEMGMQVMTPDVAFLFSWLPWIMLAVARFHETGTRRWWLLGALFLALMASVGTPNFIIRMYFVSAASILLLSIFDSPCQPDSDTALAPLARFARLCAAASMILVSAGLNGFAWAGVLEGISWLGAELTTFAAASDMWAESSMPPLYSVALFVPEFFGVLDTRHGWGITLKEGVTSLSVLSGGLGLMTAVGAATMLWLRGKPQDRPSRRVQAWTRVGLVLLVGALLTMMGRYTPAFQIFCEVFPWFFRIPHAVYYRFAQCWSVALLAGIGISSLLSHPELRARAHLLAVVASCVAATLALAALGFFHPASADPQADYAFHHLTQFGEWGWFLARPTTYFVLTSVILVAMASGAGLRLYAGGISILLVVVGLETLWFGVPMFYQSLLFEQTRSGPESNVELQDTRYGTLGEHPHYRFSATTPGLTGQPSQAMKRPPRFTGYNSRIDNQAWSLGSYALMGYSSKPLSPRFRDVVERVAVGAPYDLMLRGQKTVESLADSETEEDPEELAAGDVEGLVGKAFLRNMNVGFVAGDLDLPPTWVEQTEDLRVYPLSDALPYAYLQERVVGTSDEEQIDALTRGDLRRAVYLPTSLVDDLPGARALTADTLGSSTEIRGILKLDQTRPNSTTIEVEVFAASMLVIAETWHPGWTAQVRSARAGGTLSDASPQTVPVFRVNYLQQGVWLGPGHHLVTLDFFPPVMRAGLGVSFASAGLVFIVALLGLVRRRTP